MSLLATVDRCGQSCLRRCQAMGLGSRAAAACHAAREPVNIYHGVERGNRFTQMLLGSQQTLQGVTYLTENGTGDANRNGLKYIELMVACTSLAPVNASRVLCIGLGSGTLVQLVRECLPARAAVDVVEINRSVIHAAAMHCGFRLDQNNAVYVHHNDALVWLEQKQSRYDVIFVDAYAADGSVPAHLATHHVCQAVRQSLLDPASLVVVNITGEDKQMLADAVALYDRTFSHVLKIEVPSY